MLNIFALILIAFGGTFSVVWLIHYIPLQKTFFGKSFSPRLTFCKFLAPLDATLTLFLVAGAWIGVTSAITGISMIVYNVLTGIGISCGVVFVKKILVPRWRLEYQRAIGKLED